MTTTQVLLLCSAILFAKDKAISALLALVWALILYSAPVHAQTCPQRLQLRPVPATSRGGTIIWKSNWNVKENRENTIEEGNHSQKSAAFLIHYKANSLIRDARSLEVRDTSCRVVARLGRFPRCTTQGCGEHERWYLRSPGGSSITVQALASLLQGAQALIRLKGRQWAVVQDVFSEREIYK